MSDPSSRNATFYFAAAMPPRHEAMFPSDRWTSRIAEAGYSHLCLMNDPFFHPEAYPPDGGENVFRLLSLYDMTLGPRAASYRQWLTAVDAHAGRHGLKLALEMWEPRVTWHARRTLPSSWFGPEQANGWVQPVCLGHDDARRWVGDGFASLVRAAPHLDTLVLGIEDNNAVLCGEDCPRCGDRSVHDRLGEAYALIEASCHAVRGDVQVVPYDWMWDPEHYEAVFSKLSGTPIVLTRLERGAVHTPDPAWPESCGIVFDESLGCDEIGSDFQRASETICRRGGEVLVMPTLSGMFEGLHQLPYVPAVGQVAGKFEQMRQQGVTGWVDYDCGGVHDGLILDLVRVVQREPEAKVDRWLDTLATERYGHGEAGTTARAIWSRFDRAVRAMPANIDVPGYPHFSGGFAPAMGLVPLHPFIPERVQEGDHAAWRRLYFHFDPHKFARPAAVAAVRHHMARVREAIEDVPKLWDDLLGQVDGEHTANARLDRDITELVLLHWRSVANFYAWAAAQQGDTAIDLGAVLDDEIETTERFRGLATRSELGFGNMTWHPERAVAMSVPQASGDLWRAVEINRAADWTDQPFPDLAGDLWGWKLAHLRQQRESLTAAATGSPTSAMTEPARRRLNPPCPNRPANGRTAFPKPHPTQIPCASSTSTLTRSGPTTSAATATTATPARPSTASPPRACA